MQEKQYIKFIEEVKTAILQSRYQAAKLVNRELIILYFRIGKMLSEKIKREKWGAKVIQQIADDIQKELLGIRGFSRRNIFKMIQFYESYSFLPFVPSSTAQIKSGLKTIMPSLTAQLKPKQFSQLATGQIQAATLDIKGQLSTTQSSIEKVQSLTALIDPQEFARLMIEVGFTHHILILNKCKGWDEIVFYIQQCQKNNWTVNLLKHHLETNLFHQKGKLQSNFETTMPQKLQKYAIDAFREEYLLDFININPDDSERELENEIVRNIKQFILSFGKGFTFIGNQYRLIVDGEEFFVDLLFYNRPLQSIVAIDLKTGKFKPEYAGKMNFYLTALDEREKLQHENPSIGIILCREKSNTIVEYTFRDMTKPMGVATYKLSKKLPENLKKHLPNPESLKKILK